MALRRFSLLSCLALSFFLAACGKEKTPVAPGGGEKPVTPIAPKLVPVANEATDDDDAELTVAEQIELVNRIPVEEMREKLVEGLTTAIPKQMEARIANLAVKDEVLPVLQARLAEIAEEMKTVPAQKSYELLLAMDPKLQAFQKFMVKTIREAEAKRLHYTPTETNEKEEAENAE